MKKNVSTKGIFLLVVVALLAIGFTGCAPTPYPTTGTVYLVVSGSYYYDLYMDFDPYFYDVYQGTYTITNVPIGNHFFEAEDGYWGWTWGYDSVTQYIHSGVNNVYLYPSY
ncbi:MAG TPA: hypothetical protein VFD10_02630 [Atribacterota bacterium]|nr:hypothetical protein [Atribacterota bacterium]